RVVAQPRCDDVARTNDPVEGRMDDLFRCRGDDVEVEAVPVDAGEEYVRQEPYVLLEADLAADLDEVGPPDATVLRVVPEQVGELGARLHEVEVREAGHLF